MNLFDENPFQTATPLDVLVVEDEFVVANELQRLLEQMGHRPVGWAQNEQAALTYLHRTHPDLVLLDIFLQREDGGFSVAGTLRQHNVPFLFVTAHADAQTVGQASRLRPAGYVVKPFREATLFAAIETAWQRLRADDQVTEPLQSLKRSHIEKALRQAKGRIRGRGGAAELLGLHPNTLQSRLDRLHIDKDKYRP